MILNKENLLAASGWHTPVSTPKSESNLHDSPEDTERGTDKGNSNET